MIKYFFNFENFFNLYELLIWIYLYLLFKTTYFLLIEKIVSLKLIKQICIAITLSSILILIISIISYSYNVGNNILWYKNPKIFHPFLGLNSIYFYGLLKNYNLQAYLILPGFFFILQHVKLTKSKILINLFFIFFFIIIKSKVIILIFAFAIYDFFLFKKIKLFLNSLFFIFFFLLILIFYFLITHYLYLDPTLRNNYNDQTFTNYFTNKKIFSIYGFEFYGSIFYKLKLLSLNIFSENNFIFFNDLNFINYDYLRNDYPKGIDSHSDYFGYLANYGLFGFIFFVFFFFYFFRNFLYNLSFNRDLFLVYSIFLIESIISDVIHLHLIWVFFGFFYYNYKINVNKK